MGMKLRVGWFSFTCCEDSAILFTELLNTYWAVWKDKIEFVHAKVLRKDEFDEIREMDVAFIEGAISSDSQEEKLKKIRNKTKSLVAVGACAVIGSPSNQRNFFNQRQLSEIKPILDRFRYKEKVLKVSDIVKVDDVVPGCPMDEQRFLQIMDKYLNQKPVTS